MSNVLIGIIGVILFIGLAMAGALILGDDFKSSRATSEGAAIQQQMAQVAAAYDMYRVKMGAAPPAPTAIPHERGRAMMTAMMPRFLKTQPITPSCTLREHAHWFFVDESGNPNTPNPTILMFNVVEDGGPARAACDAVAEQAGMADANGKARVYTQPPSGVPFGCYSFEGGWGYAAGLTGNWHFFRRL